MAYQFVVPGVIEGALVNGTTTGQFVSAPGFLVNDIESVNTTYTPGTGASLWSGATPQINSPSTYAPGTQSLTWTGATPTLLVGVTFTPGADAHLWTGATLNASSATQLSPSAQSLTWTGGTPVFSPVSTFSPGTGAVIATGAFPFITPTPQVYTPGAGAVIIAGGTPYLDRRLHVVVEGPLRNYEVVVADLFPGEVLAVLQPLYDMLAVDGPVRNTTTVVRATLSDDPVVVASVF